MQKRLDKKSDPILKDLYSCLIENLYNFNDVKPKGNQDSVELNKLISCLLFFEEVEVLTYEKIKKLSSKITDKETLLLFLSRSNYKEFASKLAIDIQDKHILNFDLYVESLLNLRKERFVIEFLTKYAASSENDNMRRLSACRLLTKLNTDGEIIKKMLIDIYFDNGISNNSIFNMMPERLIENKINSEIFPKNIKVINLLLENNFTNTAIEKLIELLEQKKSNTDNCIPIDDLKIILNRLSQSNFDFEQLDLIDSIVEFLNSNIYFASFNRDEILDERALLYDFLIDTNNELAILEKVDKKLIFFLNERSKKKGKTDNSIPDENTTNYLPDLSDGILADLEYKYMKALSLNYKGATQRIVSSVINDEDSYSRLAAIYSLISILPEKEGTKTLIKKYAKDSRNLLKHRLGCIGELTKLNDIDSADRTIFDLKTEFDGKETETIVINIVHCIFNLSFGESIERAKDETSKALYALNQKQVNRFDIINYYPGVFSRFVDAWLDYSSTLDFFEVIELNSGASIDYFIHIFSEKAFQYTSPSELINRIIQSDKLRNKDKYFLFKAYLNLCASKLIQ